MFKWVLLYLKWNNNVHVSILLLLVLPTWSRELYSNYIYASYLWSNVYSHPASKQTTIPLATLSLY